MSIINDLPASGMKINGIEEKYYVKEGASVSVGDFVTMVEGNSSARTSIIQQNIGAATLNRSVYPIQIDDSHYIVGNDTQTQIIRINSDSIDSGAPINYRLNDMSCLIGNNRYVVVDNDYTRIFEYDISTLSISFISMSSITSVVSPWIICGVCSTAIDRLVIARKLNNTSLSSALYLYKINEDNTMTSLGSGELGNSNQGFGSGNIVSYNNNQGVAVWQRTKGYDDVYLKYFTTNGDVLSIGSSYIPGGGLGNMSGYNTLSRHALPLRKGLNGQFIYVFVYQPGSRIHTSLAYGTATIDIGWVNSNPHRVLGVCPLNIEGHYLINITQANTNTIGAGKLRYYINNTLHQTLTCDLSGDALNRMFHRTDLHYTELVYLPTGSNVYLYKIPYSEKETQVIPATQDTQIRGVSKHSGQGAVITNDYEHKDEVSIFTLD